ncbi:MAG TPA: AAC(3) family N-acetyltransferase [Clostridiales bacterium]|nr:AAC(3) family N-acetyltransferase [Clostridiales bacterium]
MYTIQDIIKGIIELGIKPTDTLLIHSSMKAIGEVEGGADTVLDAFIEYMKDGLLIFPTHTWAQMSDEYSVFNPLTEPSCVGLLTNLFMKRPGVVRSWHPTHSVAALGKDAASYVEGDYHWDTPCPREGCWGKLYDRKAKILFLGCTMIRNTYLHSVEEWNDIPNRLSEKRINLTIQTPDGRMIERPVYRHHNPGGAVSDSYAKMEKPFLHTGIAKKGYIGDAACLLGDAVGMGDLTSDYLKRKPDLFSDQEPVPTEWYMGQ